MENDEALDPRARALLTAYRAETGPSATEEARLLAAIRDSAAEGPVDEEVGRVVGIGRRRIGAAVVVATLLAAGVVAAISLGGGGALRTAGSTQGDAAAHGAGAAEGGQAVIGGHARAGEAVVGGVEGAGAATSPGGQGAKDRSETGRGGQVVEDRSVRRAGAEDPGTGPKGHVPGDSGVGSAGDALAGELAFVREVHATLAAGAPAGALALLDDYPRRHPTGLLREEVEALRATARCGLTRDAGVAAAFTAAYPRSLFGEKVRRACGAANENSDGRTPTARTYP